MSKKRKQQGLYVHNPFVSSVINTSGDAQRLKVTRSSFHDNANPLASSSSSAEQPVDIHTLQAVDDEFHFSYLLGQDLPTYPEDENLPTNDVDGVRVTLKPGRNANSDFPLSAWIPYRDEYLQELLRLEGRGGQKFHERCWVCKEEGPVYRCMDQACWGGGMLCRRCTVATHKQLPLHWIEEWTDGFFKTTSLRQLGLTVQLGHPPGTPCIYPYPSHHDFTVLHTNGIHNVAVQFCHCDTSLEHRTQLLRASCWPATPFDPQTCATFEVLRLFHNLNCQGKLPVYDFYKSLESMTTNRQQHPPPDRYRALLRMVRQWRHIKMCKRAGRGHDVTGVLGTSQGELAIECPACPQPEKNLPEGWEDAPPWIIWLYALFLATDANFRVRNGMVSSDERDPTLGQGWAYFVNKPEYLEHVKKFVDEEEISSCSGFAAIFLKNLKNVRGLRTTGVVGVTCSRHGLWRANGMGDLQKGERACNVDFVVLSSVKGTRFKRIVLSYDIICQWGIHFFERMKAFPPDTQLSLGPEGLVLLIPKFHLPAHQTSCQARYSHNFMKEVANTHGETIEENWGIQNKAAAQTKEMGPGSRQDTLDDINGFHNWRMLLALGRILHRRLVEAVKEMQSHRIAFEKFHEGLVENVGQREVAKWEAELEAWEADFTKPCPYQTTVQDKRSLKEVQLQLSREEHEKLSTQGANVVQESSICVFVMTGLEIEAAQRSLEVDLKAIKRGTTHQELNIQKLRTSLYRRILKFRTLQHVFMPLLQQYLTPPQYQHIECPSADEPEKVKLYMPSDLRDENVRTAACVHGVWEAEMRLREGEARDALDDLRQGLRARTMTNRFKTRNITGQVANTRAQSVQRQIDLKIHTSKLRYRYSRNALYRLKGNDGVWDQDLRVLNDEDVRGLNERALSREEIAQQERFRELGALNELEPGGVAPPGMAIVAIGEGTRTLSWIWYRSGRSETDEGVLGEALKIEWCKARARSKRWEEESTLLVEEMRRVIEYGRWKARWWNERTDSISGSEEMREGARAYALEHRSRELERIEVLTLKWGKLSDHAKAVLARMDAGMLEVELEEEEQTLGD